MLLGWSLEASSSPSVAAKVGGGLAKLDGVWRLCPDFPLSVCRQLVSDMEAIPREKPPAAGARPAAQQQQQQPPLSLQRLCRFVHCWLGLTQGLLAAHAAVPELCEAANGTGGAAAEVGRLIDRCFAVLLAHAPGGALAMGAPHAEAHRPPAAADSGAQAAGGGGGGGGGSRRQTALETKAKELRAAAEAVRRRRPAQPPGHVGHRQRRH